MSESIFSNSISKGRDFLKCTTTWEYIIESNHSRQLFSLLSQKESDNLFAVLEPLIASSPSDDRSFKLNDAYLSQVLWDRISQFFPREMQNPRNPSQTLSLVGFSDQWICTEHTPTQSNPVPTPLNPSPPNSMFAFVLVLGVSDDLEGGNRCFLDQNRSQTIATIWPASGMGIISPHDFPYVDEPILNGIYLLLSTDILYKLVE